MNREIVVNFTYHVLNVMVYNTTHNKVHMPKFLFGTKISDCYKCTSESICIQIFTNIGKKTCNEEITHVKLH